MNIIWTIAKRELATFFDSLIAYIILVLFLGFSGFFTWLYGNDIFLVGQANLRVFFNIASWSLFFFIPAITMKMLAEERKTGTLELLLTKSVSDREVILGKFLGSILLVCIALAATLPYVITVSNIGNLDNGGTICGYLGLLLLSITYTAIGIFASSITTNQIVAFMTALLISLFFQIIFGVLAQNFTGSLGQIFDTLDLQSHFESISRGVLDSKDLVYFLSITVLGLYLGEWSLSKRHIS
ncbi:ABC transporter permease subunit [Maribacter polysiphoniae]|uniref:ABC transporter permease subunit n=2 Tax=Maribacter TaxID=252356 RepID=A0A316EIL8_9FLAO|nr:MULTISPECIES: ABC transporter permease subunit [Maribacter]MBD0779585.1 ABC transporter permease subunit [Maribacter aquimaris]MBD1261445.1 ABC transporter permease subunit [Maribacter polysiphoniae]PWK22780.1 ABC-2 type transport system permease protein [Maribacter polysiphoniae]